MESTTCELVTGLPAGWTASADGVYRFGVHALDALVYRDGNRLHVLDAPGGIAASYPLDFPDHWEAGYADWVVHLMEERETPQPHIPEPQLETFKQLLSDVWLMDSPPWSEMVARCADDDEADLTPELRELVAHLRTYMHMPDPDSLLATVAAGVAHVLPYDPLWLMLVMASSSGKGERLRTLDDVADGVLSDVTLAGLLTNRGSGGILHKFDGGNALIIMRDFSTLLGDGSQSGDSKADVFNALREIYDGEFRRDISPTPAQWHGRVSFVAACTPAIDRFSAHHDSLGTRWLYLREDAPTQEARMTMARMVYDRTHLAEKRARTRELAAGIVAAGRERAGSIALPEDFQETIVRVATLVGYGRAAVPREFGNRGQIDAVIVSEQPGRMTMQLRSLALGLLAAGVPQPRARRIVQRCAMSSMQQERSRVLAAIAGAGEPITMYRVRKLAGLEHRPTERSLEDWVAIGVLDTERVPGGNGVETDAYFVAPEFVALVAATYGVEPNKLGATKDKKSEGEEKDVKFYPPSHLVRSGDVAV